MLRNIIVAHSSGPIKVKCSSEEVTEILLRDDVAFIVEHVGDDSITYTWAKDATVISKTYTYTEFKLLVKE